MLVPLPTLKTIHYTFLHGAAIAKLTDKNATIKLTPLKTTVYFGTLVSSKLILSIFYVSLSIPISVYLEVRRHSIPYLFWCCRKVQCHWIVKWPSACTDKSSLGTAGCKKRGKKTKTRASDTPKRLLFTSNFDQQLNNWRKYK